MGKKLKIFIKPKFKIGSLVWSLKNGICRADYFQSPSDDKLISTKVIGYNMSYKSKKTEITSYNLEDNTSVTGKYNWEFSTKKELKEFLETEMLKQKS